MGVNVNTGSMPVCNKGTILISGYATRVSSLEDVACSCLESRPETPPITASVIVRFPTSSAHSRAPPMNSTRNAALLNDVSNICGASG